MANVPLKSLKFPGLADTYQVKGDIEEGNDYYPTGGDVYDALALKASKTELQEAQGELEGEINDIYDVLPSATATGNPIIITDGADSVPLKSALLKGKTAAINQQFKAQARTHSSGVVFSVNADGFAVMSGTAASSDAEASILGSGRVTISGHTYLVKGGSTAQVVRVRMGTSGSYVDTAEGLIFNGDGRTFNFVTAIVQGTTYNNVVVPACIIDLTLCGFAASETTDVATLKSAWLKKYGVPMPQHLPYNAGSILSNDATYELTGRNIWDEQCKAGYYKGSDGSYVEVSGQLCCANLIPVSPNTTYYLYKGSATSTGQASFYDANGDFISSITVAAQINNMTFTTPNNCCYMSYSLGGTYGGTYNHDICINLSDPSFNGTYEPFHDGGTIVADSLNGFEGTEIFDTQSLTEIQRKCGKVNLGTLNWTHAGSGTTERFYTTDLAAVINVPSSQSVTLGMICSKYGELPWSTLTQSGYDDFICINYTNKHVAIRDTSYSDEATFTAALDGVYLVYPLATPTTETVTGASLETKEDYNLLRTVSGDIQSVPAEIEYRKDLVEYIDECIDPVEEQVDLAYETALKAFATDTVEGAIVSFPDGADDIPVKGLDVTLNPIQNLNGYDSPWPAGGGKNKWGNGDISKDAANVYDNIQLVAVLPVGTYTLSCVASSETGSVQFSFRTSGGASTFTVVADGTRHATSFTLSDSTANVYFYGQGNSSGRNAATAIDIQVEAGSTATDFAPYANVCPILGRSEVEVMRTGVNVWDEEWENGRYYNANGQPQSSTTKIRTKNPIPVIGGESYFFVLPNITGASANVYWYDANDNFLSYESGIARSVITAPSNARYLRFFCTDEYGATYGNNISINHPSTDTTYHAYTGNAYTIDLNGTVYGGTLDVKAGKVTVDRQLVTYDGSESWNDNVNDTLNLPISASYSAEALVSNLLQGFVPRSSSVMSIGQCNLNNNRNNLLVKTGMTAAEWKTYIAVNNLQIVYPLATPVEITLTATEITTLLGQNNVWSDGDSVNVEYRADTALYVAKKLAEA